MKKIITICAGILITLGISAQAPNKISYQAVIRNSSNTLVKNITVGMKISILQTTSSGVPVYVETQVPTANANGLVTIEIGGGTVVSGNFATINWANGPYFVKIETDPAGGTNYSITGTSKLLSVPYALYAANSGSSIPGPQGSAGPTGPQGPRGPQGLLTNGNTAGNTPYWNGTQWVVNNSNIHNNGTSVGIGTSSPSASAKLEVASTTQGFLPPRLTTTQRDAITSPAEGLTIYNTTANCLQWWNGTLWYDGCGNNSQYPSGSVFCASGATAIVDVTNPATGKTWMDRNLGASRAAISNTDTAAYGDLYQWGRRSDGHQCRNSATTSTLSSIDKPAHDSFILNPNSPYDWRSPQNNSLWQGVNGINNPCPIGYRLPTETELNTERLSWIQNISQNNSLGAFASPLKLPLAGFRYGDGSGLLSYVDSAGVYWSSNSLGTISRYLSFLSNYAGMGQSRKVAGFSIRCIKEASSNSATIGSLNCGSSTITGSLIAGTSTSNVSISVPYTGGNGGTYNGQAISSTGVTGLTVTLSAGTLLNGNGSVSYTITGTPSATGTATFAITLGGQICNLTVSVAPAIGTYPVGSIFCASGATAVVDVTNPATGKTWMDRNLGASRAAISSTDTAAYGDLYQWGRRSDGHQCRNSDTTSTLSSTDQPAHGNFILPTDWRSPQNSNLWQGVNGVNNPCPSGYRLPSETELDAERLSWSSNNTAGAFASPLKLPMTGRRSNINGSPLNVGTNGNYWSSTAVSGPAARTLSFISSGAGMNFNFLRASGLAVRCIKDVNSATIGSLNCGSSTITGSLMAGTSASNVSISVPYTGGNGAAYIGQAISSTGVTGLTATLSAGTLLNGNGSVSYTITGTPSATGTATFAITLGGQSCNLTVSVAPAIGTYPVGSIFCASGATAVVDVTNPATGKTWMDRNLGASRAAISSTDTAAYGDLYQWGRRSDGHQCRNSTTTSTLSSIDQPANGNFILTTSSPYDWRSPQNANLWQGLNGINNPCPSGYRLPTEYELDAERTSWGISNSVGAFASPLKFSMAGFRGNIVNGPLGALINVGGGGNYWSSTGNGTNSRGMIFDGNIRASNLQSFYDRYRADGFSVRCIKETTSNSATIGSLNCGSSTITGSLIAGSSASNVSISVPYTGGNGGTYNGQSISSTGVTGLTATLSAGTLLNGNGSVSYTITGIPSATGTATFAITLGGQSCNLTVSVAPAIGTYPVGSIFCASGATAVVEVTNPATGKTWMDRNLGASRAAISSTDTLAYGDLYQWGRRSDGHQCRNSDTTSILSSSDQPAHGSFILAPNSSLDWRNPQNTNLWQGLNGVNNPCPSGYRLPTETELNTERLSWSSNNSAGAFTSPLKLPMAVGRSGSNGSLIVGSYGRYWSTTVSGTNSRHLGFFSSNADIYTDDRACGTSVRCIKETTSNSATIGSLNCGSSTITGSLIAGSSASNVSISVPYTGGNGGTYNGQSISSTGVTGLTATLSAGSLLNGNGSVSYTITGTPSATGTATFAITLGGQICNLTVSVAPAIGTYPVGSIFCASGATAVVDVTNPATGKTWMDRNLGATRAATSSTDTAAYGDLYQWGRRSDGHQCRNSSTTSTLSSIDQPAHGNFILTTSSPYDWRSPQNANLWQGVNGVNNPCPSGYRLPTETELNAERTSWSQNNSAGAFASPLKLPLAGLRGSNGSLFNVGSSVYYWSSTDIGIVGTATLYFISSTAVVGSNYRGLGFSVRCIKDIVGTVGAINCGSATNIGTLTAGTLASGVSSSIPYTGGNGAVYNGQSISSTGVTGLTATLSAGTLLNGNGSVSYTITGTPSATGTATFAITLGGQSCNLTVSVAPAIGTYPVGSIFCASGATAVVDVTNPATGKTWMDRNLGATRAATSNTDTAAYGDLYQWGRRSDGHQCRNSSVTSTLSSTDQPPHGSFIHVTNPPEDWRSPQNTNLWQGVNGVNNPCPSGYRLPTEIELNAERLSWSQNNGLGAFTSPLKLPMAGGRGSGSSGSLFWAGSWGYYWSSSILIDINVPTSGSSSRALMFNSSSASMSHSSRSIAWSLRCLKETTSNSATIGSLNCGSSTITGSLIAGSSASNVSISVPYTGGNGAAYIGQSISSTGVTGLTATLSAGTLLNGNGSVSYTITGTPSATGTATFAITLGGQSCNLTVSVAPAIGTYPVGSIFCASGATAVVDVTNPATGKTWMDRNLGASRAAISSTDTAAYGDLYQWGRRSDGHQCRNSSTTSTLSSIDQPAHGSFILIGTGNFDWRSPQNSNLWQGVNGVNNPCPSGYRLPSEIELNAERLSWTSSNSTGAFGSPLKWSLAGTRSDNVGTLQDVGVKAYYHSSSVNGTMIRILFFFTNSGVYDNFRAMGQSLRCLKETTSNSATIGSLNCGSSTITGSLIAGSSASNVSISVPYTGGNGGTYNGQAISSTGVTGLTATLSAGTLLNGNGSVSYTITGTPSATGTATFAITLGGQSCNLTVSVAPAIVTYPAGSVFCASGATTVVNVTNPTTGKIWMDRNLGASRAAISSTDTAAYGDLYQWGRRSDGHQCRNSTTTSTLSSIDQPANGSFILTTSSPHDWRNPQNTNLWQGVNGINNPCPSGYRIPAETELDAERLSWSSNNPAGAFASPLKLPLGGYRAYNNGTLYNFGSNSHYWSSTFSSTYSRALYFSTIAANMYFGERAYGLTVRCIKN